MLLGKRDWIHVTALVILKLDKLLLLSFMKCVVHYVLQYIKVYIEQHVEQLVDERELAPAACCVGRLLRGVEGDVTNNTAA